MENAEAAQLAARMRAELSKAVVGQAEAVDRVLASLIAAGHVLLEGVPGVGKTLIARALAHSFGGATARVQFTPDLMPADVVGHVLYEASSGTMKLRRGPVFTNLLLADEINRAPAKTQAALLEVMQERQVTIEGDSLQVPNPFMTIATQNPIELEGTYPLPEAQLDRFLFKLLIAFLVYNDGVVTVIYFAALYATTTIGFTAGDLTIMFIALNLVAAGGAFGFGWVADRIGQKKTIYISKYLLCAMLN